MTRRLTRIVLLASALGMLPARADVVTLSDGSRLVGVVERMGGGKIKLITEFAGTIEIDATKLVSIETTEPVNVGLSSGDRLVGPVTWSPDIEYTVVNTEMGGIPVSVEKIEAIWPKDGKSPERIALEAQVAEAEKKVEEARAKWSLTAEFGLVYQDGNTESLTFRGGAEAKRQSLDDLLRFYARAKYVETDKRRSSHEVIGGVYYEYLFTERFYWFGRGELEYDEFENLSLRATVSTGPGYYWIKKPEHELKTHAGLSYLHETYLDDFSRDTGQLDLGLDYRIDLKPWLQFTHAARYYPTFDSLRDYRLTFDNALVIPLADGNRWSVKLGALYEYDSIPQGGAERLDQTYYANLVFRLE